MITSDHVRNLMAGGDVMLLWRNGRGSGGAGDHRGTPPPENTARLKLNVPPENPA